MSAWPVPDKDIDLLAHWVVGLGITKRDKTSVGKELRAENYKSLRARYGWHSEYQKAPAYRFRTPEAMPVSTRKPYGYDPYDKDQALKTVRFYDYQTCEHNTYECSQAWRWMRRLERYLTDECGADSSREGLTWGTYGV